MIYMLTPFLFVYFQVLENVAAGTSQEIVMSESYGEMESDEAARSSTNPNSGGH